MLRTILEQPAIYRLWQAPFAEAKFAPFKRHNDTVTPRRVLDVGCGPGTNAGYFADADYLGVDINPRYIAYARPRFPGRFEVADAARLSLGETDQFDCILVNSLLHHLSDAEVKSLLEALQRSLAKEGAIHVFELVEATGWGIDTLLVRTDRGRFARTRQRWSELVREFFEPVVIEPYSLGVAGVVLWNMIYLKGTRL